jgi:hypothetical protein
MLSVALLTKDPASVMNWNEGLDATTDKPEKLQSFIELNHLLLFRFHKLVQTSRTDFQLNDYALQTNKELLPLIDDMLIYFRFVDSLPENIQKEIFGHHMRKNVKNVKKDKPLYVPVFLDYEGKEEMNHSEESKDQLKSSLKEISSSSSSSVALRLKENVFGFANQSVLPMSFAVVEKNKVANKKSNKIEDEDEDEEDSDSAVVGFIDIEQRINGNQPAKSIDCSIRRRKETKDSLYGMAFPGVPIWTLSLDDEGKINEQELSELMKKAHLQANK